VRVDAELDRAAKAIDAAGVVSLACHVSPDGDALGSLLALHLLCRSQGKESVAAWPSPAHVAPHYRFLPGLEDTTPADQFPARPELMVTFDCGSIDRLGRLTDAARAAGELVVLDHHATNTCYGTINVVDADAAATAVLVRRLAARLGWPLTRPAAECIYAGLVTDTGRFQYSNTTPEVFALAEELARFDLPIEHITRELFEKHRFAYLQLVADVLGRAVLEPGLALVSAAVTREDLDRHGVDVEETEGLIDLLRRTAEATVVVLAKEAPEGVRVSLRSLAEVDVGALARAMGGGGHRFASGFTHHGTVTEALELVRAALSG